MFIDSHCHPHLLDLTPEGGQLAPFLERARLNQVTHMLCVSTELKDYPVLLKLANEHDNLTVSVGVHPNHNPGEDIDISELIKADKKCVAIGETGLDYFRTEGDLTWQQERFATHISAAKQSQKPLIIHTRQAQADTIAMMKAEHAQEIGGVMHCFTENWDMAKKAMDLNFYISFSGIVTFKNAVELQEVAKKMPLDRILIETDCPYLAPVPFRGHQNEPSYVRYVAEFLATLRGETVETIGAATTKNFYTLFNP